MAGVPAQNVVVDFRAKLLHGIQVPQVRDQEHEQHGPPHPHVPRGPEDKRLVDGEEEVHVCELRHGHRRAERQGRCVGRG